VANKIVHARLDPETQRLLARLRRSSGLTDSALVRRALRTLAATELRKGSVRVVGQGEFDSGVDDLGSNERHLEGFGRS
jgi:hypothetical protein